MFATIQVSLFYFLTRLWLQHHIISSSCAVCVEAFRSLLERQAFSLAPRNKYCFRQQFKDIDIVDVLGSDKNNAYPMCAVTVQNPMSTVAVVIDFENVRGFNGFSYTHDAMLSLIEQWGLLEQSCSRILCNRHLFLVVDHGDYPSSFWVPYNATNYSCGSRDSVANGYAIVFSGNTCKADDSIVHDVIPFISSTLNSLRANHPIAQKCIIQLVTADRLLIQRCHRVLRNCQHGSSSMSRITKKNILSAALNSDGMLNPNVIELEIISPKLFLAQLDQFYLAFNSTNGNALLYMEEPECFLLNEESCSAKSMKWSKQRHRGRKDRIANKKESTEDRIVLAEELRIKMEHYAQSGTYCHNHILTSSLINTFDADFTKVSKIFTLAEAYVHQKGKNICTTLQQSQSGIPPLRMVSVPASRVKEPTSKYQEKKLSFPPGENCPSFSRLVVISDTHGFESQLEGQLPDGDVLLHLGDFAVDTVFVNSASKGMKGVKSRRARHDVSQLAAFDAWIAKQPHPLKIVVRGNHDPKSMAFLHSGAIYITQPTIMDILGFKFAFVPYQTVSKNGLRHKTLLPKTGCDVIVSHVPPFSILDRCHTGKLAGSVTLLKSVQRMNGNDGPPILWLCGHIHESRGVVRDVVLCKKVAKMSDNGMTVVNAACANLGHARYLEYGPVLLELSSSLIDGSNTSKKRVKVSEMDGQFQFLNSRTPYFFQKPVEQNVNHLLLAVDLGLRTGISLFDCFTGKLLRFEHFQYETIDSLERGALTILQTWENTLNSHGISKDMSNNAPVAAGDHYKISYVAIEGSDQSLLNVWTQAIGSRNDGTSVKVLTVTPNDWRTDLLTSLERQSGESAKEASQRIAKLIIKKQSKIFQLNQIDGINETTCSLFPPLIGLQTTPTTDVAESILIGYHVLRRLGCRTLLNLDELTMNYE